MQESRRDRPEDTVAHMFELLVVLDLLAVDGGSSARGRMRARVRQCQSTQVGVSDGWQGWEGEQREIGECI